MQNNERTWSRRATTIPHHRHQSWNNIEMLKVNTGDWLSFTVAPARERSLSPCSIGEHPIYESGSKFTKAFKPIKLVYTEEYDRIDEAFKRERQIHGWSHAKKEALIKGDFDLLKKLSKSK